MLPIPSNALERSSAQALGLITGYFPWIMSSGIERQDSFEDVHNNHCFIDIVNAIWFRVHWRKHLVRVSNNFDQVMKCFWVDVSFYGKIWREDSFSIGGKIVRELHVEHHSLNLLHKIYISKKIFQHIVGMGRSRGAFCYSFCSSRTSVTWEKVAKMGVFS
jgi:hypothetical protein